MEYRLVIAFISALTMACENEKIDIVSLLIEEGADINRKGRNRQTPLHIAVFKGFHEIVKILLQHGARANEKDGFGQTALKIAINQGYEEIEQTIIQAGGII